MTRYEGLAVAVDRHIEKTAGLGGVALNVAPAVAFAPSEHRELNPYDPVAQKPWYSTGEGLANLGDWTIGFIPGIGSLWSLGRAGWAAAHGNWGEAALHGLGAVPFVGRGLSATAKGARAAVAAGRTAGLVGKAARGTAAVANGVQRAGAVVGKVPGVGVLARNPRAVGKGARIYHDWVGLPQAHGMASERRADEAINQAQQQRAAQAAQRATGSGRAGNGISGGGVYGFAR